jgi:hypothetical protein
MIGGISKCIINSKIFIGDIVEEDASQALPILDIMNFGV